MEALSRLYHGSIKALFIKALLKLYLSAGSPAALRASVCGSLLERLCPMRLGSRLAKQG
jgi:hypothetical protein